MPCEAVLGMNNGNILEQRVPILRFCLCQTLGPSGPPETGWRDIGDRLERHQLSEHVMHLGGAHLASLVTAKAGTGCKKANEPFASLRTRKHFVAPINPGVSQNQFERQTVGFAIHLRCVDVLPKLVCTHALGWAHLA